MEDLLHYIKRRTSIEVYERDIRNVLGSILSSNDFWRIVDLSEEPLPLVATIIDVLKGMGYVEIDDRIQLTKKGMELIRDNNISRVVDLSCENCSGRGIKIDPFRGILDEFKKIVENRPLPKQEFDQAFVTPETVIARLAFIESRNDLRDKDIFVIGDDDLTSIALMMSGLPKSVSVIDIDERLTNFIEKTAKKIGYDSIEILTFDIREELPKSIYRKFDTFITDPPETLYAIRGFVGRGISSLKGEGCAGYLGLTRRESSLDKWMKIERIFVDEFNVVITDIIRNFNEYVNWGYEERTKAWELNPVKTKPSYNWYRSYMIRISTLKNSKGFEGKIKLDKELYDDEESSTT